MFWLVETKNQFEEFCYKGYKEIFVEIIPYNNLQHPSQNSICAVYIRPVKEHKGYILPIFHTEVQENLYEDQIYGFLKKIDKIYCRDKKEFLHYFPLKQTFDITISSPASIKYTPTHSFLLDKYPKRLDLNTIVPIVKHYEYCEAIYEELEHLIEEPINEFYNNKGCWTLYGIEKSGIKITPSIFSNYFYQIEEDYIYTQYNFKTLTTRPSNTFNGINYAALNKENGCRKAFIARNTSLVEFDISAYHPTLLAKLVGYDFGDEDIYSHFAKIYGVDRQEAKILTLQQFYGGILPKYREIEFFKKVQAYIDDLWKNFQELGYIECAVSGFKFYKDKLENMNPQKLLNYVIQNLETANNINIMWEIFKILKGKNSKLVLYTYDSFLIDFDDKEKIVCENLINIFKLNNLTVKTQIGNDYDF